MPARYDWWDSDTAPAAAPRRGTRTAVNRAIARKLRKLDCDPVGFLARVTNDEEVPLALRFRAAARLATLLHNPRMEKLRPEEPEPEPVIAAIIAGRWQEDDGEVAERRAAKMAEESGRARPDGDPTEGQGSRVDGDATRKPF